ncbi:BAG family molecular chaperone regulator 1-like isoform X2 [Durio zibethinus]|nr:BAG family molecular chaperone regulator 1-like isoform X2 [Durio zibethinus]
MLSMANKKSIGGGESSVNPKEWEVRPGGMLVQKRDSSSIQTSFSIPTIRVRVKYGSTYHDICISSQASFGDLKKMLADHTGLHPLDQKLTYKNKERDSKAYLDVAGVKDGSKILLVEDIASKERRCLEMLKNAKMEKSSKSLSQIGLEVEKFADQVKALEATVSRGHEVQQMDVDNLTGFLMTSLVRLDELAVKGDLKLQKKILEKKVQKHIETLDAMKLQNKTPRSNGDKIQVKQHEHSMEKGPIATQKEQMQEKQKSLTDQMPTMRQKQRQSEPVVFTTKWETFD